VEFILSIAEGLIAMTVHGYGMQSDELIEKLHSFYYWDLLPEERKPILSPGAISEQDH